jgi:4-diphosphocytidyl-2-C-methyl-D-erythritol kinase
VLIVYPGFHISTPEAYANIHPNDHDNTAAQLVLDKHPIEWEGILRNDFESFAFKQYPLLNALKNQLYTAGAAYASMTGSGSALFGIFDEHPEGDIQARFSPYFTHVSLL